MKKCKMLILLAVIVFAVSLGACSPVIERVKESIGAQFSLSYMDDYGEWKEEEILCTTQDLALIRNMSKRGRTNCIPNNRYYDLLGVTDSNGVSYFDENGYRIEGTEIADGAHLTAQYSPKKMTFVLNARGGSVKTSEVQISYGSEIESFEVPAPPSPDMKFLGWYMLRNTNVWILWDWVSTQVTDSEGKVLDDYRVLEYRKNSGYELDWRPIDVYDDDILGDPYSFGGEDRLGQFNGTLTLYAKWAKADPGSKYGVQVKFEYGRGVEPFYRDVELGAILNDLPVKQTNDMMVLGWSYERDNPQKMYNGEQIYMPTVLYAVWAPYKSVQLYSDGVRKGEVAIPEGGMLFTTNEEFAIKRGGYELEGWYDSELGGNAVVEIRYATAPEALYARWRKVEYTVMYHTSGTLVDGVNIERAFYDVESETFSLYDLKGVCPEHYTFLGWCRDAELQSAPLTEIRTGSYGNLDLYPKFRGDSVTVILDMQYTEDMQYNDGKETMTVTVEYGSNYTLQPPVNLGYSFAGWYDAPAGGAPVTDSMGRGLSAWNRAEPCTVYARWVYRGEMVTVTFVDGDSVLYTQPICTGDTLEFPVAPQKEGYIFVGWFNESLDAQYFESDKIYADVTLYAKWVEAEVSDDE